MSEPTRVTFFTHYAELYGANLSLLALIDGLRAHGVQACVVACDPGDLFAALAARGVPAAVLPFEWWVSTRRSPEAAAGRAYRNLRHLRAITRQLREWGTDLVYSNASVFNIGAMAAADLGLPHVWHLREFGRQDYDLLPDLGRKMHRLGFLSADATVCVSHAIRKALLAGTERPSVRVIYNGVGPEAVFEARKTAAEQTRGRTQPFTFALVGRFRESKGQHVALRAFAQVAQRFPGCRLIMVGGAGGTGDQEYYERCLEMPHWFGLADRVDFWGYIPDPERAFLAADCALMCSRSEAMGRVTAEAMSCVRPVIGFDAAGTSELISHGQTGLLYRGGSDALAECMTRYAQHPEEARQHGEAGWALARQRHTTEGYAAQIHEVIRGVLARYGSMPGE